MYSVVVQLKTLTARYPGGVDAYAADCPNRTFCSDGELCRVGFMSWADTEAFIESLARCDIGLQSDTLAIIREDKGLLQPSGWLEFKRIDGTPMAGLAGSGFDRLVAHPGWTPDHHNVLTTEAELQEKHLLRDEGGVATYRDRSTGEVLHVGRALTDAPHRKRWWRFWE